MSCGLHHTAAVDNEGAVWCWGDSSHGQCGTGEKAMYFIPQRVFLDIDSKKVKACEVHCGAQHTVALTVKGELWSWGKGYACALRAGLMESLSPHPIEYLHGRNVLSVRCGYNHTMALVERLASYSTKSSVRHENRNSSVASTATGDNTSDFVYIDVNDVQSSDLKQVCPLGVVIDKNDDVRVKLLTSLTDDKGASKTLPVAVSDAVDYSPLNQNEYDTIKRGDCKTAGAKLSNVVSLDNEASKIKSMCDNGINNCTSNGDVFDAHECENDSVANADSLLDRRRGILQTMVPVSVSHVQQYVKGMTKSVMSNIVTSVQRMSSVVRPNDSLERSYLRNGSTSSQEEPENGSSVVCAEVSLP